MLEQSVYSILVENFLMNVSDIINMGCVCVCVYVMCVSLDNFLGHQILLIVD